MSHRMRDKEVIAGMGTAAGDRWEKLVQVTPPGLVLHVCSLQESILF